MTESFIPNEEPVEINDHKYYYLDDDAAMLASKASQLSGREDIHEPFQNFIEGIQRLDPEAKDKVRAIWLMEAEIEGSTQLILYGMGTLPSRGDLAHKEAFDRFSVKRKELFNDFAYLPKVILMEWDMTEKAFGEELEASKAKRKLDGQNESKARSLVAIYNPERVFQPLS